MSAQLREAIRLMNVIKLHETKAQTAYELEPKSFEKKYTLQFWDNPTLARHEAWLVQKCVEDKEYREEVLKAIDELIKVLAG